MRIRSEARRRHRETGYGAEQPVSTTGQWDDIYGDVDEAIARLPEKLRRPTVAHFFYGLSHGEIARDTGISRRTVSKRVETAVERIGKSLRKRGVDITALTLSSLLSANLAEAAALPVSLSTALGKLALAQAGTVAATSAVSTTGIIGGAIVLKKALIAVAVVFAAGAAFWVLPQTGQQEIRQAKLSETEVFSTEAHAPDILDGTGAVDVAQAAENEAAALGRAESFPKAPATASSPSPDEPLGDIADSLGVGSAIEGVVVNASGSPVRGAAIYIGDLPYLGGRSMDGAATSGADGQFRLESLAPGMLRVWAYHPDATTGSSEVEVLPDRASTARIVLPRGGTIRGTIRFQGVPVPEKFAQFRYEAPLGNYASAMTDADGNFIFSNLPPGPLDVFVYLGLENSKESNLPPFRMTREALVEGGKTTIVDFDFGETGYLDGVISFLGQPVSGGWVKVRSEEDATDTGYEGQIDRHGQYAVENVPAGTATMQIMVELGGNPGSEGSTGRQHIVTFEIPANGDLNQDFEIEAAYGSLKAKVTGLGANDTGAVALLRGEHHGIDFLSLGGLEEEVVAIHHLSRDDEIYIENLMPGVYTVFAMAGDEQRFAESGGNLEHVRAATTIVVVADEQETAVAISLEQ
jgi:hypothetical protein